MAARTPRRPKAGPERAGASRRVKSDAAAEPAAAEMMPGAELIKAGLKALGLDTGAVTRHNRVFDAMLGIDPSAHQRPVKDLFRLPTFEDLFDERVARALDRIGTAQALADLRTRLDAIDERLRRLEKRPPERTPRARR